MSDQKPKESNSDAKIKTDFSDSIRYQNHQFEQLVKLATRIGGIVILAITIVASTAIVFTYSNVQELKGEVAGEAIKIAEESTNELN